MQEQQIEIFGIQPPQAGFDAAHDMRCRQDIALRTPCVGKPDAAFGLQQHVLAQTRLLPEKGAKTLLSLAQRIDFGMIKQGNTDLERCLNSSLRPINVLPEDCLGIPPAAEILSRAFVCSPFATRLTG